jgi:hypothetical protein
MCVRDRVAQCCLTSRHAAIFVDICRNFNALKALPLFGSRFNLSEELPRNLIFGKPTQSWPGGGSALANIVKYYNNLYTLTQRNDADANHPNSCFS